MVITVVTKRSDVWSCHRRAIVSKEPGTLWICREAGPVYAMWQNSAVVSSSWHSHVASVAPLFKRRLGIPGDRYFIAALDSYSCLSF